MSNTRLLTSVLLLIAPALHATSLDQVKQKLAQLPGNAPMRARVDIQVVNEDDDDGSAKKEQGSVTVEAEKTPAGISIIYPEALISQAEREAAARRTDPEKTSPIRGALGDIDVLDINSKLDAAGNLLRDLAVATLVDERAGAFQGKPARLLTLKIVPKLSKAEKKRVKKFDETLKLWIDSDGMPLYAERVSHIKASFLVVSFEQKGTEKNVFSRKDDHLIIARHEESNSGSGFGQSFKRRRVVSVTVK